MAWNKVISVLTRQRRRRAGLPGSRGWGWDEWSGIGRSWRCSDGSGSDAKGIDS